MNSEPYFDINKINHALRGFQLRSFLKQAEIGSSMKNINSSKYVMNYSYLSDFEKNYDANFGIDFMKKYEWIVYPTVVLYILLVFGLQKFMKNRPAYEFRIPLFLWNFGWSVFAIVALARLLVDFKVVLSEYGLTAAVCLPKYGIGNPEPVLSLWTLLFVWSKIGELGDTLFLILRKRKVIFLHWYHHATALYYCWISYAEGVSTARIFAVMNTFVHSFMYLYFALSALNIKLPRKLAFLITVTQISQMVVATLSISYAYLVKIAGYNCHVSYRNIHISLSMYFSYVILFSHFFIKSYFGKPRTSQANGHIYKKKTN